MWPNPSKIAEFKVMNLKKGEEIRKARAQLKQYKKYWEEAEKKETEDAINKYYKVEQEYLDELARRKRAKLDSLRSSSLLKSKSSELSSIPEEPLTSSPSKNILPKHSINNLSFQKAPSININPLVVPKIPPIKTADASNQYEISQNFLKHKATITEFSEEKELKSKTKINNNEDTSTANESEFSSFESPKKEIITIRERNIPPPMILKQVSNDIMFVHIVEKPKGIRAHKKQNTTGNFDSAIDTNELNYQRNLNKSSSGSECMITTRSQSTSKDCKGKFNQYYHMFREFPFDKSKKRESEKWNKMREYYEKIKNQFSPTVSIKNKVEVEIRKNKTPSKNIKDIPKIKISELAKKQ